MKILKYTRDWMEFRQWCIQCCRVGCKWSPFNNFGNWGFVGCRFHCGYFDWWGSWCWWGMCRGQSMYVLLGSTYVTCLLCFFLSWSNQIESPRCESDPPEKCTGKTATLCISMVDSMWLTILDALSLILTKLVKVSL